MRGCNAGRSSSSPSGELKTILNLMWRSKKKKRKKAQYACKKCREQYVSYEILETRDELHPTRNLTFPELKSACTERPSDVWFIHWTFIPLNLANCHSFGFHFFSSPPRNNRSPEPRTDGTGPAPWQETVNLEKTGTKFGCANHTEKTRSSPSSKTNRDYDGRLVSEAAGKVQSA